MRIQLRRVIGWRMPPNTVKVARPCRFSNPYRVSAWRSAAEAVAAFEAWLAGDPRAELACGKPPTREEIRKELRGKNLACWCLRGKPCHADVLLRIANEGSDS